MVRWFPKKVYHLCGLCHIFMGIAIIVIAGVALGQPCLSWNMANMGTAMVMFFAIFCGALATVAGILAVWAASTNKMHRREGTKTGAAIICTILAVLIAWYVAVYCFIYAHFYWNVSGAEVCRGLFVAIGTISIVIWIISLFICFTFCCCSPYESKPPEYKGNAGAFMNTGYGTYPGSGSAPGCKMYETSAQSLNFDQPTMVTGTPGYVMHSDLMHMH